MPLKYFSNGALIALLISIAGCQTIPSNNVSVSETDVAGGQVSSTEPRMTDEAMYDPLAIVRELGEAVDSPNVTEAVDDDGLRIQSETDLAAIEGTIWAEIINGFALEDLKETKYADLHRRRLTHSPGFFADFLVKADIYLPYVWTEVKRRGLPAELALLPYVESAYSPWAVSRMGAVGMWQIMPGTARVLNLKLGQTCDQRRDVIHSTRAALDYLEQMHANSVTGYSQLLRITPAQGALNVR